MCQLILTNNNQPPLRRGVLSCYFCQLTNNRIRKLHDDRSQRGSLRRRKSYSREWVFSPRMNFIPTNESGKIKKPKRRKYPTIKIIVILIHPRQKKKKRKKEEEKKKILKSNPLKNIPPLKCTWVSRYVNSRYDRKRKRATLSSMYASAALGIMSAA